MMKREDRQSTSYVVLVNATRLLKSANYMWLVMDRGIEMGNSIFNKPEETVCKIFLYITLYLFLKGALEGNVL